MRRIQSERRVREMSDMTLAVAAVISKDSARQMDQFHEKLLQE